MNIMTLDGHRAKIEYDPELELFRGEILGINGGADFYGKAPDELRREFRKSLDVFLEVCKEKDIEPLIRDQGSGIREQGTGKTIPLAPASLTPAF